MEASGLVEGALGRPEEVRQGEDHRPGDDRASGDRLRSNGDLVERRLAADPARRGRDEVPLRDARGVERAAEVDRDLVIRLVHRGRVAGRDAQDLRTVDQALGPQESDRELVLEAGGPHRDGHRDRILARAGCANLERLLADDAVRPELQGRSANRHDAGGRDVARRRGEGFAVHAVSVRRRPAGRTERIGASADGSWTCREGPKTRGEGPNGRPPSGRSGAMVRRLP
jgi:hypothetical protein